MSARSELLYSEIKLVEIRLYAVEMTLFLGGSCALMCFSYDA